VSRGGGGICAQWRGGDARRVRAWLTRDAGLPRGFNEEDLKRLFSEQGVVTDARIMKTR
jgi:hypothetical protein